LAVIGIIFTISVLTIYEPDIAVIVAVLVTRYFVDSMKISKECVKVVKYIKVLKRKLFYDI